MSFKYWAKAKQPSTSAVVFLATWGFAVTLSLSLILTFVANRLAKLLGLYVIVSEQTAAVILAWGNVYVLDKPGLNWLPLLRSRIWVAYLFGKMRYVDLRLDQGHLTGLAVNAQDGEPMDIGIWSEFRVKDPQSFLFAEENPKESLGARIRNKAHNRLNKLKLDELLKRKESKDLGREIADEIESKIFNIKSIHMREVRFRDNSMVKHIEKKVVNNLTQSTARTTQAGVNEVENIEALAKQQAAEERAQAAAVRPRMLGDFYGEISQNPSLLDAFFACQELLRLQKNAELQVHLIPSGNMFRAPRIPQKPGMSGMPGAPKEPS